MSRLTEHEYFMQIAIAASQRSTCPRKSVGAILVRNKLIVSTGYNGSARGLPHCIEAGCLQDGHGHCQRVVHAEINCIVNAFEKAGAWLYTTDLPCIDCTLAIINAGIVGLVYRDIYVDEKCELFGIHDQRELLWQAKIEVGN